jgi:trimethylamine--corrinoid protein Co-methyltransferase
MARRNTQRAERLKIANPQLPWKNLVNPIKPVEVLSADEVEHIHQTTLRVLAETGMEFMDAGSRQILKTQGCDVDESTMRVRFDPAFIEENIAKAPSHFRLRARNPLRNIEMGGSNINFVSVIGPAYCSDLDRGRRTGTSQEVREFVRLLHSLNSIHLLYGTPFEAMDLAPEVRHLQGYINAIELSDKCWGSWMLGRFRAEDALDMTCMTLGESRDDLKRNPACIGNINTNSPLRLDVQMTAGALAFAEAGQAVIVTPFTLAGAMAPITVAGALVGQNAEALAVIAFLQAAHPGTPCVYGSFTSNVDMRTGAPCFGTPEYSRAAFASGQLARRYNLPWRSSSACVSNTVDAQAAYESEMSLWSTVMSHCNFIIHGGGWLEGGLTASFEKLIIDAEMLQMMTDVLRPIQINDAELAQGVFKEVGPGGHFFGTQHTLDRYQDAFYQPLVSDWRSYGAWNDDGALNATQRANRVWKQLLESYEQPELNPDLLGELKAFALRREREIKLGVRNE